MTDKITWYFVSTLPDKIDTVTENGLLHYRSRIEAEDAITNNDHGDYGTRYVIKAELETVATATRSWELRRDAEPPASPPVFGGLYDPPSPTGPGV